MKRQMKIAAVVSATALLAIGASFTSMAAAKNGTWKNEDGVWYCYDKEGDVIENEFCLDGGEEFYVGEDGAIVYSQWVERGEDMYYINSEGKATKGAWKKLVPHNDEDADAEWYYFAANGKMAKDKKLVVEGNTYYFDAEGSVLYGWVDTTNADNTSNKYVQATAMNSNVVYTDEETGARVSKTWINTYVPGLTDDEKEDADKFDYYIKSNSKAQTGMGKNISGQTFFFDANGKMLKGWILETDTNTYVEIDGEGQTAEIGSYGKKVYFGCTVDGHAKKNKWIYEWSNVDFYDADADNSKVYYWVQKDGTVFIPAVEDMTASNAVKFEDAESYTLAENTAAAADVAYVQVKNISDKYYAFDANGKMKTGLYELPTGTYLFDKTNGNRVTGNVTLTDEYGVDGKFLFSTASADKGAGITGTKNGKLYNDGMLITAKDAKYAVVSVDGDTYIVNASGSVQTTKKIYKDGDDVIVNAEAAVFDTTSDATAKGHVDSGLVGATVITIQ